MKNKIGKLFVLEGLNGAGKSTLLEGLKRVFPQAVFTREPGGTPFTEELRTLVRGKKGANLSKLAQFHLVWAARASHIQEVILPALEVGKLVICDRFDPSTFVYDVDLKDQSMVELFWSTRRYHLKRVFPHYLYLSVSPEIAQKRRVEGVTSSHFDEASLEEFRKRDSAYRTFLFACEHVNKTIIDANQEREVVLTEVVKEIKKLVKS